MKRRPHQYSAAFLGVSIGFILACNLVAPSNTPVNHPSPVPATAVVEATDTAHPAEPTTAPTGITSATVGPQCTVLQQLNLRSGPGTAYNPPVTSFSADTVLIPTGYKAAGIPGGTWVQVEEPNSQQKGWVSAGPSYVSCTTDITKLPDVTVAAPPAPQKPRAQGSNGEGACLESSVDGGDGHQYSCKIVLSEGIPVQARYFRDGKEIGKDLIKYVAFVVWRKGSSEPLYTNNERNPDYCLFGGDGPCDAWVLEDYLYKWGSGGPVIETGKYTINIDPVWLDGDIPLHWQMDFRITVP